MRWLLCGPPLSYTFFCFLCISVCVCQACVAHFCHSDVMCLQVCLCLCSLLVAVCSCALSFLHWQIWVRWLNSSFTVWSFQWLQRGPPSTYFFNRTCIFDFWSSFLYFVKCFFAIGVIYGLELVCHALVFGNCGCILNILHRLANILHFVVATSARAPLHHFYCVMTKCFSIFTCWLFMCEVYLSIYTLLMFLGLRCCFV